MWPPSRRPWLLDRARRARVEREDDRLLEGVQRLDDPAERELLRVRLPVHGRERRSRPARPVELERLRALARDRREAEVRVEHDVSDDSWTPSRSPRAAGSRRRSPWARRGRLDTRSTSTRLSSSGIVRSKERRPASTWATGTRQLRGRERAGQGRVRVPVDEHQSGCSSTTAASMPGSMRAVCSACVPEPASSRCVGGSSPSSSKKTCESSGRSAAPCAGRPLLRLGFAARARAGADFMNCGRLPTTERICMADARIYWTHASEDPSSGTPLLARGVTTGQNARLVRELGASSRPEPRRPSLQCTLAAPRRSGR